MKRASTMPAHIAATKIKAETEPKTNAGKAGPRQKTARQSPADAKDRGTCDDPGIDVASRRKIKSFGEERPRELQDATEADEGHSHRACHHEGEARIPCPCRNAAEVEEVQNLRRVRH